MIESKKKKLNYLFRYRVSIIFSFFLILLFTFWYFFPYLVSFFDFYKTPVQIPFKHDFNTFIERDDANSYAQIMGRKYGTYGDSYGALNTLFSGLAFAFLALSLYIQGKELARQKLELKNQQAESERANRIAEEQRKIAVQQAKLLDLQVKDSQIRNFYDLFFKYIEIKEKKVVSLRAFRGTQTYTDIQCFSLLSRAFINICNQLHLNKPTNNDFNEIRLYYISALSKAFYDFEYEIRFPFKRSMYLDYISFIIKFIESNSELIDTKDVVKILLSNFNEDEVYCLLWIGMKNDIIFNFNKNYQIQLTINYEIPISVIDVLYYTYGMKDFILHGIEYEHEG
ncbi:hypothetical protein QDT05_15060 [Acinetobacter baumannii]|uniref:hypothetical protein n=1 Tax=Acinetobacter baumannii TaxID=470 RepID=UPI002448644C|nr:hypothetical protein [Acinetobacter baumannii]MDH2604186.1 hypothetical protein [Acinetobacter baumannii]